MGEPQRWGPHMAPHTVTHSSHIPSRQKCLCAAAHMWLLTSCCPMSLGSNSHSQKGSQLCILGNAAAKPRMSCWSSPGFWPLQRQENHWADDPRRCWEIPHCKASLAPVLPAPWAHLGEILSAQRCSCKALGSLFSQCS